MSLMNNQESARLNTINETKKEFAKSACCGIYGLRNKITGKWYVGQSIDIHRRWHLGYELLHCKEQVKIYRALLKYGYDGFDKIILEECDTVDWILDYRETYWIRMLGSIKNGYNLKEGGCGGRLSEETKNKISRARTGKKWTDEQRKIISIATTRACNKEEYKEKISKSWIKRRQIGVSDDTRAKMTVAKLNQSSETRRKIADANRRRKQSDETKNKIRAARKEYWRKKKLDEISI